MNGLTIDEARELAKRWSWWHDGGVDRECPSPPHTTEKSLAWCNRLAEMYVTSEDMERLLGWVRQECERLSFNEFLLDDGTWALYSEALRAGGCKGHRKQVDVEAFAEHLGITVEVTRGLVEKARQQRNARQQALEKARQR